MASSTSVLLLVQSICFFSYILAVSGVTYKDGEKVMLYVNKVGPYSNPQETYHYYVLPICQPDKIVPKSLSLGEVLEGDRMAESDFKIKFKQNGGNVILCKETLSREDLQKLRDAVENYFYFEFIVDDLPVRGFVGHLEEMRMIPHTHKIFLWTHFSFLISYNGNQIVSANVTMKSGVRLDEVSDAVDVSFSYSVTWIPTNFKYIDRLNLLQDNDFFPKSLEVHWLSVINSMVLVFLLIGFIIVILTRVLRNDFARYDSVKEESAVDDSDDDYGWKIIHTDVFRFPENRTLFCAILGVGTQFLAIVFGIMIMALSGLFAQNHSSMNSATCILYALTCFIAGFVSANMYKKMGGDKWVWNINFTTGLFAIPFFVVWSIQNTVAWIYKSTQALPFTTILLLLIIWLIVGYPLTVIGGITGKNKAGDLQVPCRTKLIKREVPVCPWYKSYAVHCLIGGFLPFSAISVELYYIFATVWGRQQYTLYGILLVIMIILLSVTACVSIAITYFQLSAEDYRWWWRSIFSAGSTGFFVFLYAMFYYFKRSTMSGTLQFVEFFGYTVLICYIFFLTLGTVSFFASLKFVRYIYQSIKMD